MAEHERPTLVVFQGGTPDSGSLPERLVVQAQHAAALDLLATAANSGSFECVVLVSEDRDLVQKSVTLAEGWTGNFCLRVEASEPGQFHFGHTLQLVCSKLGLERVVYAGGASMPLATPALLADLAIAVGGGGQCVVANNLFSADVVAFWPAEALGTIVLPAADNDLAWRLHFKAGLPFAPMPRTLAGQFDIDTPTDLATLWWSFGGASAGVASAFGQHLQEQLAHVPDLLPHLARNVEAAYKQMATLRAQVMLAGRVSSWVWRRLEVNLPCQTRVLSEERGMRAGGREAHGEVVSLLGLYVNATGISGLVHALENTCDAAFLDTRVLFAHMGLKPSVRDRFASDALLPDLIADPWVRELTEAMIGASIPIVLGGHSLISGGVWALSDRIRRSASSARS